MAERTIVVCDICGKPATETVTIKAARGNFAKDLCATHVTELTAGARRPRPGRPRKLAAEGTAVVAPRGRGRPRKSSTTSARAGGRRKTAGKKTAGKKAAGRKTTGRRKTAGRRKAQASSAGSTAS